MTTPPVVSIYHESEDLVTIKTGDGRTYDACHDEVTGDWLVATSDEGDIGLSIWLRSRDGAIQYILERLGIIENASYDRAPDRC